jgi:Xaa-Pro aminopeptidase
VTFSDATGLIRDLRAIKSEAEVALLRRVGELSDLAGQTFFDAAVPGASEREVVARIDAALIRDGTEQMGYFTILGSGRKTVASCFLPTADLIRDGDVVQLDCAPMVDGYKGDFSRVVVAGTSPRSAALRLVDTVAEMHEACAAALRAGRACSDVARVGLEVVERRGYTRNNLFKSANYPDMVFMAHGIGLENPDPPGMLTLTNTTPLRPGMVINLEPILIDPDVGGARIETTYLVTDADPVPLSTLGIRPWAVATSTRA